MKSGRLSAFFAAFSVMLAVLAFIVGVTLADRNSMSISGNTGDEVAMAFSMDADMLCEITLFNERFTLDLGVLQPVGRIYAGAGAFYSSLLPEFLLWPAKLAPKLMDAGVLAAGR